MLNMSVHLTKQLGMAPGGEFRTAFHEVWAAYRLYCYKFGDILGVLLTFFRVIGVLLEFFGGYGAFLEVERFFF